MGSVYKQPETEVDDSCHSWRVPVSKRGHKGRQRGANKGEKKSGELRHVYMYLCHIRNRMIGRLNDIG
jgi:hypothetical protein